MPVTKSVIFVVVFAVVSSTNASKNDKKSGIYAHHHADKCEDYRAVASKCHMWKDLGFCFKHRKEMEFVCSKTCKFCVPGESHWTFTSKPDENAKAKTIIETPNKPSPVVEVMGKKKALYLSSNDIAGMLQTLSSQNYGVTEKPTPKPKELAVIQGRIQKVEPVVIKADAKGVMKIKPTASAGGKMQSEPKVAEKEDSGQKDKAKYDAKAEDKNKEGKNRENSVESKVLRLMSQIIREGAGEKEKKPEDNASDKKKVEPLNVPEMMKILQNLNEKTKKGKENPVKEQQATEQKPPNSTNAEQKANATGNQLLNAKNKAILAAMKLFKAVGPAQSASKGNKSSLMEQLAAAAEEASVALKLLNKTGAVDKLKEANIPSGGGNVMYNVKLLQEELNKANKNNQSNVLPSTPVSETNATANTSKMAVVNVSSSNPQLSEFILKLQDSITNPQGTSLSSAVNQRGGVAMKKEEGKPTLSEIIPFNIKVDDAESDLTGNSKSETPNQDTTRPDTKVTYQSDEEKIMKILDGLDQDDDKTKTIQDKGNSAKDIVMQIREAYDDLGEIVNGAEIQEGIKKKKKKEDEDNEETEESSEEKKKKDEKKDEKDSKDEKEKKGKDEEKEKEKEKKKKDGDDDDDDDDDVEYFDPSAKPKPKKKKPLTKEQHLEQVLSLIKKAGHHLEVIGAKRVKMAGKAQDPSDEDASIRSAHNNNNNFSQADWKTLATRLARQLGLVLKKMAEKDEKYKAERTRLKSVLAALAQTELSLTRHGNDDDTNEEGDEENDEAEYQDEDRSKIIHNMATKLLKFSKTISAVQKSSQGKPVRKKKKVLHNLISRYRNLVTKILANWKKLKGKKKSGIPRRTGKRGEIVRGNGNHTANAVRIHDNPAEAKVNQTETKAKQTTGNGKERIANNKSTQSASLTTTAEAKKTKKKAEKDKEKEKVKIVKEAEAKKKEIITPESEDEQDVVEVVHK